MEFTQTAGTYRFNTLGGTQYFEINSSGIEAKVGNISGSSTSTGSFGSLVSKGTTTLDGQVFVDTDSGNQPFYITRVGNATEALKIHVDDFNTIFESIQDEASDGYGGFDFKMDGDGSQPDFRILKGSGELLRVEGSGKVGIGATSPDNVLHVSTGDNVVAKFESTDANATLYLVDNNTSNASTFKRTSNDLKILENGGNVLFPNANVKISGSSTSTGSFGSVHVPDRIGVDTVTPKSQLHIFRNDSITHSPQNAPGGKVVVMLY